MAKLFTQSEHLLDFHPFYPARVTKTWNLKEISADQQKELNEYKIRLVKKHHKYLKNHPEIKDIINVLMKAVLIGRPLYNVKGFLSDYVAKNRGYLQDVIAESKLGRRFSSEDKEVKLDAQIYNFNIGDLIYFKDPTICTGQSGISCRGRTENDGMLRRKHPLPSLDLVSTLSKELE